MQIVVVALQRLSNRLGRRRRPTSSVDLSSTHRLLLEVHIRQCGYVHKESHPCEQLQNILITDDFLCHQLFWLSVQHRRSINK